MNKEVEQKRRIGEELIELGRAAKLAVKSAAEWGRELGIVKGNGEHEGDYQVRVMQALEAWKKGAVPSLSKPPRSMSND